MWLIPQYKIRKIFGIGLGILLITLIFTSFSGIKAGKDEYKPREIEVVDHTEYFKEVGVTHYEGSKSCLPCHMDEVVEVFHSYHYQLYSLINDTPLGIELPYGSKYSYNDFCGNIFWEGEKPVNWIGYVRLKRAPEGYEDLVGSFTGLTGCSMCHGVGMGLPPSPELSEEQLNNIDCLACHVDPKVYISGPFGIAKGMKNVSKDEEGRWRYIVNVDIDLLAKNIIKTPTKDNCLACHAVSGGGPHLKRPNLSPELMGDKVSEEFDIHIARGFTCVDCHVSEEHGFPTKSLDTFNREEDHIPTCTECHGEDPHTGILGWFINTFHDRVACQTCHIPEIAGGKYPTDLHRDWSVATFNPKLKRWKFSIPNPDTGDTDKWYLDGNVTPVYLWYNGRRDLYIYPNQFTPITDKEYIERFGMTPVNGESLGIWFFSRPMGDVNDPNAKIYPFKLHTAIVAYSTINKTMVPMKVGIAFATGNTTLAYLKGANSVGMIWTPGEYITLVRFMQVNHGVKPADKSLTCLDCHGFTPKRLNWSELGYGYYPEVMFTFVTIGIPIIVILSIIILRKFFR